jgi:hypothetical protein
LVDDGMPRLQIAGAVHRARVLPASPRDIVPDALGCPVARSARSSRSREVRTASNRSAGAAGRARGREPRPPR